MIPVHNDLQMHHNLSSTGAVLNKHCHEAHGRASTGLIVGHDAMGFPSCNHTSPVRNHLPSAFKQMLSDRWDHYPCPTNSLTG
jgi:hypothetical protein